MAFLDDLLNKPEAGKELLKDKKINKITQAAVESGEAEKAAGMKLSKKQRTIGFKDICAQVHSCFRMFSL